MDARTLCSPISTLSFRPPTCVNRDTPVSEVINLMQAGRVGCVLVVEAEGQLAGIITERDLVRQLVGPKREPAGVRAEETMTQSPEALRPSDPIAFAVNLMHLGRYRHIPLIDDEVSSPIGYISTSDILRHMAKSLAPDSPTLRGPCHREA